MAKTGDNGHNGHGLDHRGHVSEIPDVSYIKNVDVTHEASDVSVSGLLKFVIALSVMTAVVALLMWGLFRFFKQQESQKEPPKGPMAMSETERLPPEPRLQSAKGFGVKREDGQWVPLELAQPQAEFRVLYQQWQSQLHCQKDDVHPATDAHTTKPEHAAPTDMQPCVRIGDAMKMLVQQGLPSRTQDRMAPEPQLPTAASSGRQKAGGKQ
jgi:hypothetical protein